MSLLTRTALSLTRTARPAVRSAVATQHAKRRMGSAAAPEWTGIDKVVRGYFPQDDQREFFAALYCCVAPWECVLLPRQRAKIIDQRF